MRSARASATALFPDAVGPKIAITNFPSPTTVYNSVIGLAVVFLLLAAGCGGVAGTDWEAAWKDRRGRELPEKVVATYRGPEHCEWQSAVFLHLGWPLGREATEPDASRTYIRDAEGLFEEQLRVAFDEDVDLPPDAEYTGYHRDDVQLWISPEEAENAVYIVRGGRAERWPRPVEEFACA